MGDIPLFYVITGVLALVLAFCNFLLKLFGWLKIESDDIKKFITIRGRKLAWNFYLIIAILITIYFLFVVSLVLSFVSFSLSLAMLLLLILWGLLGVWSPAIQRLRNQRINQMFDTTTIILIIVIVVGFWIVQWPDIQAPIFVTLLLLAIGIVYIVDRMLKTRNKIRN